ncbi:MAG TPA: Gfo/Idh/MocA family oxidoreductase [Anaerovoracaceae bacterium]|nr:Gfo/Idh/MocA family oxidoreductase [Anaerovoracaceae bacterium]
MSVINAAVIGFGLAGSVFHAPIINSTEGINLKTIYTANSERKARIRDLYPNTAVTSDLKEIFRDEDIQLVTIAAPNTNHYNLAEEAILAGKNVVVDKPFTILSQDADKLIELAQKKNVVLSVYQNRRWDGDFKTVKKVIESGMLGPLVEFESHIDRFRNYSKNNWREQDIPGSGLLFDLGPHMIDQALYLFGLPSAVTADVRIQRECAKTIDNFELILHYEKLKVTLKVGMLVKIPLPRFILQGENGSFVKYGMDVQEDDLANGFTPLNKKNWGQEPEEQYGRISAIVNGVDINGTVTSEAGDYREYYKNLHDAITQGSDLIVTPQQAANVIKIIEHAIKSNEMKRTLELNGLYEMQ